MAPYKAGPSWQLETQTVRPVVNDPLAIIYNEGQWKLNNVSPLNDLKYDAVKLKQYGAKIRQAIVSAAAANSKAKYTIELEAQPNLKYSESDADALLITVSSTQDTTAGKKKVAYSAILLSWGKNTTLEKAVYLPYMLERGDQKLGAAVKCTLRKMFDCNIVQYTFSQYQLLEFGFNFLDKDSSRDEEAFTLVYTTPQVEHKDKIKLSFHIEDMRLIWYGVKKEATQSSELLSLAYQMLQNQVYHMVMLDISAFDLCEVILPKAEAKNTGIVKMKTPEMVNTVFLMLNKITNFVQTESENNVSD